MIFVYGGYDVIPVPAGEALDPRRHVPFALIATIIDGDGRHDADADRRAGACCRISPAHSTPIADAAAVFLGSAGALLVGVGSVVSMTGNNAGQVLSGSRMLFALAEHGELPAFFGRIHPRYRTPANAVIFTSVVAVVPRAVRLVRQARRRQRGGAAGDLYRRVARRRSGCGRRTFADVGQAGDLRRAARAGRAGDRDPGVVGIAAGATREQLLGGFAALAAGAVMFAIRTRSERRDRGLGTRGWWRSPSGRGPQRGSRVGVESCPAAVGRPEGLRYQRPP